MSDDEDVEFQQRVIEARMAEYRKRVSPAPTRDEVLAERKAEYDRRVSLYVPVDADKLKADPSDAAAFIEELLNQPVPTGQNDTVLAMQEVAESLIANGFLAGDFFQRERFKESFVAENMHFPRTWELFCQFLRIGLLEIQTIERIALEIPNILHARTGKQCASIETVWWEKGNSKDPDDVITIVQGYVLSSHGSLVVFNGRTPKSHIVHPIQQIRMYGARIVSYNPPIITLAI